MNVYEAYMKKILDDDIQEKIEGFSSQGKDMSEKMFRAGFIAGKRHVRKNVSRRLHRRHLTKRKRNYF